MSRGKVEEEIKKCVEEHEIEWGFADDLIYNACVEAAGKVNFCKIKESDVKGPIKTFLNNWGIMGRVLARLDKEDKDWQNKLAKTIRENCNTFVKFRTLHLEDCDIDGLKSEIEHCYDAIKGIVKATAASKTLHLLNCNFFPLWDAAIRKKANERLEKKINDTPEGYFNFMVAIQRILRQYDGIISILSKSKRYKRPKLRIVDIVLHKATHKEEWQSLITFFF